MDYFHNNKKIGSLVDGVYRKRVKKSKHLMRMNDAWGIQYEVLQELKQKGCTEIRVLDTEDNIVYITTMDTYFSKSQVMNWGDGQQAFLPRGEWNLIEVKK